MEKANDQEKPKKTGIKILEVAVLKTLYVDCEHQQKLANGALNGIKN